MRDLLLGLLSLVIALLVLALGGELLVRGHLFTKELISGNTVMLFEMDDVLGWRAAPNYRFSGELHDAAGQSYTAKVSTDSRGFRAYGDPGKNRRAKLMFLGDSFTHAEHVSDENTYFNLLGETLSLQIFALGVGGYGTLQQYLMLDQHIDEIQPDAVVIQLCPNDFINNSFELEFNSARNNNHKRRPYYANGEIQYRLPKPNGKLWHFANEHSRLLYFLLTRLDRLRPPLEEPSEALINRRGKSYPPFAESIKVTGELLAKIRQRIPAHVPVYTFVTGKADQFRRLSEQHGIEYIAAVPLALNAARAQGETLEAWDGAHWNNAGHRVVAEALAPYLEALALVPQSSHLPLPANKRDPE